jgi:hypothetical protein
LGGWRTHLEFELAYEVERAVRLVMAIRHGAAIEISRRQRLCRTVKRLVIKRILKRKWDAGAGLASHFFDRPRCGVADDRANSGRGPNFRSGDVRMSNRCRVPVNVIPNSWWGRPATQNSPLNGTEPDRLTLPHTNISTRRNHEQAASAQIVKALQLLQLSRAPPVPPRASSNGCRRGASERRRLRTARLADCSAAGFAAKL